MWQSDPLLQQLSEQVGRAHARALARSRPVVAGSRIRGAQQPQSLPPPAEGPAALITATKSCPLRKLGQLDTVHCTHVLEKYRNESVLILPCLSDTTAYGSSTFALARA